MLGRRVAGVEDLSRLPILLAIDSTGQSQNFVEGEVL